MKYPVVVAECAYLAVKEGRETENRIRVVEISEGEYVTESSSHRDAMGLPVWHKAHNVIASEWAELIGSARQSGAVLTIDRRPQEDPEESLEAHFDDDRDEY
jgi:hypothetical protein